MLPSQLRNFKKLWARLYTSSRPNSRRRPAQHTLAVQQLEERLMLTASDQLFAGTVYQDLLRRPAEPEGLAFWTGLLKAGASREDVALKMTFATDEYRTDQVQSAFQSLLGRPADPDGSNHYLGKLKAGGTVEQMKAEIIGSPEYFQNRAGASNANFLKAIYEDVFIRDPDAAASINFTAQIGLGVTRTGFATQLLGSAEYRQNLAENLYEQFLLRTGESGGLDHWVGKLAAGATDEQVVAGFPGSPEYSQEIEHRQTIAGRAPLAVPGATGQTAPVTFTLVSGAAGMPDELGLFRVDALGNIGNIAPGAPGYAAAALANPVGQILFAQGTAPGAVQTVNLPAGSFIGLYLIQGKTTKRALLHNASNELGSKPLVFFSLPQANPDLFDHVHLGSGNQFSFEDLTGGGDQTFNDLVVKVAFGGGSSAVDAHLTDDTGASAVDRITSDASLAGTVTSTNAITSFRAAFDGASPTNGFDVLSDLKADGSFSFTTARLNTINGSPLADGAHVLHLQASDAAGNASTIFDLAFTLDTHGPATVIQSPASGATANTNVSVTGQVGDSLSGITTFQGKIDNGAFANISRDGAGNFSLLVNLPLDGSADGSHTVSFQATDLAGNISTSSVSFTLDTSSTRSTLLSEGTLFHATHEQDFTIPTGPALLTFSYSDLSFATPAPNAIQDAFEVALVDANNKPLVHTIGPDLDAFFNITRGGQPVLAPGVTQSGQTISVNLAGIVPGTAARLIFRLMNDDGTTTTSVRLFQAQLQSNPGGQPVSAGSGSGNSTGSIPAIDFSTLSDVSGVVTTQYGQTAFDEASNVLTSGLVLHNTGSYAAASPLVVTVSNISDPSVRVRGADGTTPDGLPYYDLSNLVSGGTLTPGSSTTSRNLEFSDPNRTPFTYDLVVLGQLNRKPLISSAPVTQTLAGRSYVYAIHANDPDGNALTFSLPAAPSGMSVDPTTGQVTWSPAAADLGKHTVIALVDDGHGGTAQQQFTLTVADFIPNRPPVFTSTPVVDAYVAQSYQYPASAVDADGDAVSFSLIQAPPGMNINSQTGQVSWTPPSGPSNDPVSVVVAADDGKGGTAKQTFALSIHSQPGNHRPVIISAPEINAFAGAAYVYQVLAQDPDSDPLRFTKLAGPAAAQIDSATGSLTWAATAADLGTHSFTVAVDDGRGGIDSQTFVVNVLTPGEIHGIVHDTQPAGPSAFSVTANLTGDNEYVLYHGSADGSNLTLVGGDSDFWWGSSESYTFNMNSGEYIYSVVWDYGGVAVFLGQFDFPGGTAYTNRADWEYMIGSGPNPGFTLAPPALSQLQGDIARNTWAAPLVSDIHNGGPGTFWGMIQNISAQAQFIWPDTFDSNASIGEASYVIFRYKSPGPTFAQGAGWTLYLDQNNNGKRDAGEPFTQPAKDGSYAFTDLAPGTYTVAEEPRTGWTPTAPTDGINRVDLTEGQVATGVDFNNRSDAPGEIDGTVFNDFDRNGALSAGEPGISGWTVFLDENSNGILDANEVSTTTLADGSYRFLNQAPGGYRVRIETPTGWKLTNPSGGANVVTLPSGQVLSEVDFAAIRSNDLPANQAPVFTSAPPTSIRTRFDALQDFSIASNPNGAWSYRIDDGTNSTLLNTVLTSLPGLDAWWSARGEPYSTIVAKNISAGNTSFLTITTPPNLLAMDPEATPVETRWTAPSSGIWNISGLFQGIDVSEHSHVVMVVENGTQFLLKPTTLNAYKQQIPFNLSAVPLKTGDTIGFIVAYTGDYQYLSTGFNATITLVGDSIGYTALATDPDGDPLTYDMPVHPQGAAIDPTLGTITWTPVPGDIRPETFLVRVTDGRGGLAIQHFTLTAGPPNTAPAITSIPSGTAVADLPYQYQIRAQDAQNDPISFGLINGFGVMAVDPVTGLLTFHPSQADVGSHTITVTSTDPDGASSSQAITLTVVATATNHDPVISSTGRDQVRLGANYIASVQATDPDGDPLSYQLITAPSGMTIGASGLIVWTPSSAQFGANQVELSVTDGRGGQAVQSFTVNVLSQTGNHPPVITSSPVLAATASLSYRYNVTAIDADDDLVAFSLQHAPAGMSIDPLTGAIRWQASLDQLGAQTVTVQAADTQGGTTTQSFTVTVRGSNLPPVITSTPVTTGAATTAYTYAVAAFDPEGRPLTYDLLAGSGDMSIDASGVITWNPTSGETGAVEVLVHVTDDQGASTDQPYTILVADGPPNHIPDIVSTPPFNGIVGKAYAYQPVATDADGDPLQFSLDAAPSGMRIDPTSGQVTWTPTSDFIGVNIIKVVATDPDGAKCIQTYSLTVRAVNHAPVISSTPGLHATPGHAYEYDVQVSDADGDPITYSLDAAPTGMSVDSFGRITWLATPADLGTHHVKITAVDGQGGTTSQTFDITVGPDITAPQVAVFISGNPIALGDSDLFVVTATDDVGVATLDLTVNGQPVALDANGRASVDMTTPGNVEVVATATDAAGNKTTKTATILVIDPSVTGAPTVDLTTPAEGAIITAPTDVIGTVQDDHLTSWTLSIAPLGSNSFTTIASGATAITNGVLGKLDPTLFQNDSYTLRLTALNSGGFQVSVDNTISISGALKLGNFTLSFTDVQIPVSGIPITVTRTYDTLQAGQDGELGFGWTLAYRDVDFRTSIAPSGEEPDLYTPFRDGARVYITLPGGRREGFTFKPKAVHFFDPYQREVDVDASFQSGNGLNSAYFVPSFLPDPGVTDQLEVSRFQLTKQGHEYFSFGGGFPYNPTDESFGGAHIKLVTTDGLSYSIDATTGSLNSVTDRNGNSLLFGDDGIQSSSGVKVTFDRDANGRITAVTDPAGNVVRYTYDNNGDLVAVTDAANNTVHYTYLASLPHRLDQVIDPMNRTLTKTEYDADGRLIGVTGPTGAPNQFSYNLDSNTETLVDSQGRTTINQYDDLGNTITTVDALGGVTKFAYDDNGNVVSTTDALGRMTTSSYDDSSNLLSATNVFGGVSLFTYDSNNNQLTSTDPLGNTTTSTLDAHGNPLSTTDALGQRTEFQYDDVGNLIGTTDANGNVTKQFYNGSGGLTKAVDPLGRETDFVLDANGRTLDTTSTVHLSDGLHQVTSASTYDAKGNILTSTNPMGATTQNEFDATGNQIATTDALGLRSDWTRDGRGNLVAASSTSGATSTYAYSPDNLLTSMTDSAGRTVTRQFDALNREIAVIYPDDTPANPDDNPRQKTEYDAVGRITAKIDELGNRTEYTYDDVNRRVVMRDALNHETITTYDVAGQAIAVTDPLGNTTRFVLDAFGRTVQTIFADGSTESVAYGALGNGAVTSRTDQLGRTTHYEYDAVQELTAVIDPLGQRTEYTYDELGHQTSVKDANGHVTRYEYDLAGHQTAVMLPTGERSTTEYDLDGRVIRTMNFNGDTTTTEYDASGRPAALRFADGTSEVYTYNAGGSLDAVTTSLGTTHYQYDARGRQISRIDPDGTVISYSYDASGNRTSVSTMGLTTTYSFDALNRMASVTDSAGKVTKYTYDADGRLIGTALPNGVTETRSYDVIGHLLEIATTGTSGPLADLKYAYDAAGQTTVLQEATGRKVQYSYDLLGRLFQEQADDPLLGMRTTSYSYDAVGNRTGLDDSVDGSTSYVYDMDDRLVTETHGADTTQYAYDKEGNNLSRIHNAIDQVFNQFDTRDRLVAAAVTDASGTHHEQDFYNPSGILVAKTLDGVETRYVIDQSGAYPQIAVEYRPSGIVVASYVRGNGLISESVGGVQAYVGTDALGSTRLLSDATGAITDRYNYDAFGTVLQHIGTSDNAFLYTGEMRDALLGLDYHRARFYDPSLGRFVSRDSANGSLESPLTMNRYLYGVSNPLKYTDPTGHGPLDSLVLQLTISAILVGFVGYSGKNFLFGGSRAGIGPDEVENMKRLVNNAVAGINRDDLSTTRYFDNGGENTAETKQQLLEGWAKVLDVLANPNFIYSPDKKNLHVGQSSYKFVLEASKGWRTWIRQIDVAFATTLNFREVRLESGFYTENDTDDAAASCLAGILTWTGVAQSLPQDWTRWPDLAVGPDTSLPSAWNWVAMAEKS